MRSPYSFVFVVMESGSLSKAAAILNVSQAALSKRLQRLEDELDVKLFERTASGMRPTLYATALASHARIIQADLDAVVREIEQLKGARSGYVTLGASPTVAAGVFVAVTLELARSRPDVRFTLIEAAPQTLVSMVLDGEIAFAACTAPMATDELRARELRIDPLFEDSYVVLAAHDHKLARRQVSMETLARQSSILTPGNSTVRQWFDAQFASRGIATPVPRAKSTSINHIRRTVEAGTFLTFSSMQIARVATNSELLVPVMPKLIKLKRPVAAISRAEQQLSPAARLIRDYIATAAGEFGMRR